MPPGALRGRGFLAPGAASCNTPGVSVVVQSALLLDRGFAHGFSLRTGGVSEAPFDSLNLGRNVGDDPDRVRVNHARFASAVGFEAGALFEVSQVHGRRVREVVAGEAVAQVRREEADGLYARGGAAIGVRVADCVPVLMADPRTGLAAAVHSGWRGTEADIVGEALSRLVAAGARAADVCVAIGPHIRRGAFEVGDDVADRLAAAATGEDVVDRTRPRPHVDLGAILRRQLARAGVAPERVDDVGGCTHRDRDRFFSYRRDGVRSGRHLAVIVSR